MRPGDEPEEGEEEEEEEEEEEIILRDLHFGGRDDNEIAVRADSLVGITFRSQKRSGLSQRVLSAG